jgi:hypothetical protein
VGARATGGRDDGAAERRLAEALRAQAFLGGRSAAAAPPKPGGKPATPRRGGPKSGGPRQKAAAPLVPAHQPPGPPARGGQPGHQSGPQHATPRPAHPGSAGRTGHSGGQPARPRDDQLPTTKVVTADPGAAGAPTTQHAAATSAPARPPHSLADARTAPDTRLRLALLVALLVGVLLGCALALLSVLGPGLLPAIG